SLEQSLWFLHKYVCEAADRSEALDQVLVPILQHALSLRESKKVNQSLILLNWLYQDEVLFQVMARNMAAIISRRDDRYVALGWCFLGRSLIEYENVVDFSVN
ncbi:ARM repeat superfamily protein, partial [Striga hermonthica]